MDCTLIVVHHIPQNGLHFAITISEIVYVMQVEQNDSGEIVYGMQVEQEVEKCHCFTWCAWSIHLAGLYNFCEGMFVCALVYTHKHSSFPSTFWTACRWNILAITTPATNGIGHWMEVHVVILATNTSTHTHTHIHMQTLTHMHAHTHKYTHTYTHMSNAHKQV